MTSHCDPQPTASEAGRSPALRPSVAAIIHDDHGRLLLQEKALDEGWSLPAGGIEIGETPREAVIREVLEETGWDVVVSHIVDVFGGHDFRYTYPDGHHVEYVVILFRCDIVGGDGIPRDEETRTTRYFSRDEMPELALPYPLSALFDARSPG
ncbi:NUDIX domain-containing protein [Sphingobium nicotianae]|uniref:NUDIX domain-containing protein n=1 Tax=Sphingobium nicotianae TaxID=2782607 RepID=A0A9X1DD13_9SPHN|nr:NUDIX domain-containing protein [Sphingobium nicotianae]MBT2187796.1 NUDIX domain-containing protein [Sphingobium nicotianae]